MEKLNKFRSSKMCHKDESESEGAFSGGERCADLLFSMSDFS